MNIDKSRWQRVKFGDVVRLNTDRCANPVAAGVERYIGLEHIDPQDLCIRRWGQVVEGTTFTNYFRPGQVLFGKRRAYQRKVAVADFEGVCSSDIYVFEVKDSRLVPNILPFLCQSEAFYTHAVGTSAGSLSPRTNWEQLGNFEFLLPPVEEQKRIASLLDSQLSLLESQQSALHSAGMLREAVRQSVFSLEPSDANMKSARAGLAPHSWEVRTLSDLFEFLDHRRIPLKDSDRKQRPGPYPYYGASGIIDSIDGYIFDEPTLLLSEDGMNLVFRSSPVVYKATGKYWVNNHAHVLRPKANTNIDFYLEFLEHISYLPYVTGTYQKKITKTDCMAIPAMFPPYSEQSRIAEIFRSLDEKAQILTGRLTATSQFYREAINSVLND